MPLTNHLDLLEAVDAGVLLIDATTNVILHANPKALELLGKSVDSVVGRQCHGLECLCAPGQALPLDLSAALPPQERTLQSEGGRQLPVLITAHPLLMARGPVSVLTITDLSPLKQAERKYQSFFQNAVEGVFQSTPDGRFIAVNPALAEILGYESPEELISELTDLRSQLYIDPQDRDHLLTELRERGRVTGFETRFRRKDGGVRWINTAARQVRDESGEVLYIEGLNIDITERKNAEAAVRMIEQSLGESEERFRRTFDQSPIGAALLDLDWKFLRVNEAFCLITGYDEQELLGTNIIRLTHPEDVEAAQARSAKLRTGEIDNYELEKRYIHKEGYVIWVHLSAALVRDSQGKPLYYLPMVQDITERKASEEALARTEARLKTLLTSSPAVIYSRRPLGNLQPTFISDNIEDLTGFTPDDFLSDPNFWHSRMDPDDVPALETELRMQMALGQGTREYRFTNAQGLTRWIRDQFRLVLDPFGRPQEIVGYLTDVTARRLIKEALESSEARYRAIVEDQTELVWRFRPDGAVTFANAAVARYFGKPKDELLGAHLKTSMPTEERVRVEAHLTALTPEAPTGAIEYRLVMADGEERWLQRHDHALFDQQGRLVEFQSVGRDITERILSERALKTVMDEKERLRLNLEAVFRSIPDAIIVVNTEMEVIQTNRALNEICCIGGETTHGMHLHLVAGHCQRGCFEVISTTLKTREPVLEYRVECKGHRPGQTVVINSSPLLDPNNNFVGAVLVIRDITRLADLEKRLTDLHGHRGLIGKSKLMRSIYSVLDQLSEVESTVLVTGESGTGKELVAEALHYGGPRAKGPLIKVNCSALSESLLESELFGHVRGAFTGAIRDKMGRFEAAEGGTIFLDEIGDISPRIQLNLLRVLERKEYERVGDSRTRRANVRVIAATNVNMQEKIRQGLFREDLYYRLKVMVIHLPPLRERTEDIPLLCEHFLGLFRNSFGKHISKPSEEVMRIFMTHPWPGNVRELRYALEHACILCPGGEILPSHLPRELTAPPGNHFAQPLPSAGVELPGGQATQPYPAAPFARPQRGISREDIESALTRAGGNRAKAARLLGVDRRTLYRNMDKHGIV
ncbi:PAS domain S-box protein [Fundidesulfovibrio agrisoli]|uniref:PAS domain S-box protein n=1 Tax=Fundidesulfovibrio agrisoli TaxID=2922717 RepID=UPI001FAC1463|nr:PAS domain S-box protein [Fundidesulfovibrio agrisoli]